MRKYKLTAVSTWNWPTRCIYLISGWPQKVWKGVTRNIWIQIYSSYGHCKLVRQGMLLLHSATTVIGPCVWGTLLLTESAMLCSSRCTHFYELFSNTLWWSEVCTRTPYTFFPDFQIRSIAAKLQFLGYIHSILIHDFWQLIWRERSPRRERFQWDCIFSKKEIPPK